MEEKKRKTSLDDFRPEQSTDEFIGMDILENDSLQTIYFPELSAEEQELTDFINARMANYNERRKEILTLYLQQFKLEEISELLDIPLGTVKSNIHYSKKDMRKARDEMQRREGKSINGFWVGLQNGVLTCKVLLTTAPQTFHSSDWIQADAASKSSRGKKLPGIPNFFTSRIFIALVSMIGIAAIVLGTLDITTRAKPFNAETEFRDWNILPAAEQAGPNAVATVYSKNIERRTAEQYLQRQAIQEILSTKSRSDTSVQNASMGTLKVIGAKWKGNDYLTLIRIDEPVPDKEILSDDAPVLDHYYVYCTFQNVHNGGEGKILYDPDVLVPDDVVSLFVVKKQFASHLTPGYATEKEASKAADYVLYRQGTLLSNT